MLAENLVVGCIYLCLCMMLFDLYLLVFHQVDKRLTPRRDKKVRLLFAGQIGRLGAGQPLDAKGQKWLMRFLTRPRGLDAFLSAMGTLGADGVERLIPYYAACLPMLESLVRKTRKEPKEYRAQLAYVLYRMDLGKNPELADAASHTRLHDLSEAILEDVIGESVYLRENTLRAVITIGRPKAVRHALQLLARHPLLVNHQLLADDLLLFPGNPRTLLDLLHSQFEDFCPMLQVSCINYMRLLKDGCSQERFIPAMQRRLESDETNGEVRLAAIRFFASHPLPAAKPALLRLLADDKSAYNFAAVAAMALKAYPGQDTVASLVRGLSSRNWYVRFNCADSLLSLGVEYEAVVRASDDPYAREMMIYRSEVLLLRKENRENVP